MKSLRRLLLGLFLIGNLAFLACLSLYIVRLPGKVNFRVLPKDQLTLVHTYQDVRDWTAEDIVQRPTFVNRVIESGHTDWLPQLAEATTTPQLLGPIKLPGPGTKK
jgi:hypothetical protein